MMLVLLDVLSLVVTAGDSAAAASTISSSIPQMESSSTIGKLQPKSKIQESHPTHPHQGKVTPFQPGDPNIILDDKALEVLARGQPYQTQVMSAGKSGGRGMVVQDINAPAHTVWGRILDYDNYAKMVPKTVESQNYQIIHHDDGDDEDKGNQQVLLDVDQSSTKRRQASDESSIPSPPLPAKTIYTRMKIGFPMLTLQFYVKHLYYPELNSLTWTLDYSRKSDLDDSCGYWYVVPISSNKTRVFYAVEVSIFDWVPSFVVHFLKNKALTDATAWVKKYSEQEFDKIRAKQKEEEEEAQAQQQQLEEESKEAEEGTEASSDTTADTTDTDTSKDSTMQPFWRGWFAMNKSPPPQQLLAPEEETHDGQSNADDETCASVTSTELSEEANDDEQEEEENEEGESTALTKVDSDEVAEVKLRPSPVGLTRYALVASVFALSLYNVHLYFSS
jgi:hypothetical protein